MGSELVANFFRAEVLTEQSTTSATFVDVPGASVTFTPSTTAEIWLVFVTGVLRSNNTAEVAAEMQLDINGTVADLWGHQNNTASTPNGAGFMIIERITGTVASQTVKAQFRAAAGTTFVDDVRIIVTKLPSNADFQYTESDGIVGTTGSNVQVASLTWTPGSVGDYILIGKMSHHEFPSGSTSQAWATMDATTLHPDAPAGVHQSMARDAWNPMCVAWRENLSAASHTLDLRFTSGASGAESSEHRYRKLMAFRADAFDEVSYSEALAQSTTTATTFQTKDSLAVARPPEPRDYLVIQSARISGTDTAGTSQKAGELRVAGSAAIRTNHHINRNGTAAQGYHHFASYADAKLEADAVTYANGFLSPQATTVQCAESVIIALRYPSTQAQAPFFGIVA